MNGLACVAVLVVVCATARAEDKDKSREAYRQGTQHYDLAEFKEALESFKEAYRDFEDPAFLFNIAQCHRQLGANRDALYEYKAYLRNVTDAPNGDQVRELIAKLEQTIAEEQATKNPPPHTT